MEKQVHVSTAEDRNTIPVEIIYIDKRFHSDKPEHEKFVKLTYGTEGAAAVDMIACIDKPITIRPGERIKMPTGIKMWLNNVNSGAFMLPRSGIGSDHGIVLANLTGLIDSDYQGEMKIPLWNSNPQVIWDEDNNAVRYNSEGEFVVHPGDRICQMTLLSVLHGDYTEVVEFSGKTQRGEGGFGSTKGVVAQESDSLYKTIETEVHVHHIQPSPIENYMRVHATHGNNPVWMDIRVGGNAPDISNIKLQCKATFKHRLDWATSLVIEQDGEEYEWLINLLDFQHQYVQYSDLTKDVQYRVGGTNILCAVHNALLEDFNPPSADESTMIDVIKGENGKVRFAYPKKETK